MLFQRMHSFQLVCNAIYSCRNKLISVESEALDESCVMCLAAWQGLVFNNKGQAYGWCR